MTTNSRIISIAPTFSCAKKCKDCYLTTGVTKEMRDAELSTTEISRILSTAYRLSNYNELAISWNPMPGQDEAVFDIARNAMAMGYKTINITTTIDNDFPLMFQKLLNSRSRMGDERFVLSLSCDDIHGFESLREFLSGYGAMSYPLELTHSGKLDGCLSETQEWASIRPRVNLNLNLLWTPGVFRWLFDDPDGFKEDFGMALQVFDTIQHLMLKPLDLYGGWDEFIQMYTKVFTEHPKICIAGNYDSDGKSGGIIGDATLNSIFKVNPCAALHTQMLDIDPMGNVRVCPENPNVIVEGSEVRDGFGTTNESTHAETWRFIEAQWLRHTHTGTYDGRAKDPLRDCSQCSECNCITGVFRDISEFEDISGMLPV